jgi:hypothetical protein
MQKHLKFSVEALKYVFYVFLLSTSSSDSETLKVEEPVLAVGFQLVIINY